MEAGLIHVSEVSVVPSPDASSEDDHKASPSAAAGVGFEVDEQGKTPVTLPRYDPLCSASSESQDGAWLKLRLAHLQMEAEEKAQARRVQLELKIRKL